MSNKKFLSIWIPGPGGCVILAVGLNIASSIFSGYMDLFLGGGEAVITRTEGEGDWDSVLHPGLRRQKGGSGARRRAGGA